MPSRTNASTLWRLSFVGATCVIVWLIVYMFRGTHLPTFVYPEADQARESQVAHNIPVGPWGLRDVNYREPWPDMDYSGYLPGKIPPVLHYLWCGKKKFRFGDYLSVLSAIRIFEPLKLVFHFTNRPETDSYNTWFKELEKFMPGLEMRELNPKPACGSTDMLNMVVGFLSAEGGVYLSDNVVLTRAPKIMSTNSNFWSAFSEKTTDKTRGVILAFKGFSDAQKKTFVDHIISSKPPKPSCVDMAVFNKQSQMVYCLVLDSTIFPRDITEDQTPFAELARWLFYGTRALAVPKQEPDKFIPRITHYVRLRSNNGMYKTELSFNHYLNVLSAIYVAGFEHVYMHMDDEPTGPWWKELVTKENVTLVRVVKPETIFQQRVKVVQHVSDITRYLVLYRYGGAYQDFDVTWTSRVSDSLLSYPFVAGMEWVQHADWPEAFNLGVMLSRPQSAWLRHYIQTHLDFRDTDWGYNSLRMSYRTYELYPHLMHLDRTLQVLCCYDICHPAWEKNYVRPMSDSHSTIPFKWREVSCIHVTCPKPHPSLSSAKNVKRDKNMYAEIGRFVLTKSGRTNLIS